MEAQSNQTLYLEHLADRGDRDAQYYLSIVYEDGRGVVRDLKKAGHWCTRAALAGDPQAQYRLSKMLESNRGFAVGAERRAGAWLRKAALNGHVRAQFELGVRYLFGVKEKACTRKASKFLNLAGDAGHAEAIYYLGLIHLEGLGVACCPHEAAVHFKKAAALGCPKAQCSLACMYELGVSCPLNRVESERLYLQSARAGHVGAQFGLGCFYLNQGDASNALPWLRRSARSGVCPAQALLARLYTDGLVVKRNLPRALMYCLILDAEENADEESKAVCQRCRSLIMNFAEKFEIQEGQHLAKRWLAQKAEFAASPVVW